MSSESTKIAVVDEASPRKSWPKASLSLTGKLILGFAFALALQILQMVLSAYFTVRLQHAAEGMASVFGGNLAVQHAAEAVQTLRERVATDRRNQTSAVDARLYRVYLEELLLQESAMQTAAPGSLLHSQWHSHRKDIERELQELEHLGTVTGSRCQEALEFLDDALLAASGTLHQLQIEVRNQARAGVADQQGKWDLPLRASIAITTIGILLMCAFVAWFSRQLVQPIQEAQTALEQRVAERTLELATTIEQLRQAKEVADGASRAKSRLLANVSHELRTPLTAILGFAEELRTELPTKNLRSQSDALATIETNAQHLVRLVNDLLDASKLEAGKMAVEQLPVDLGQLLADVQQAARLRADQKGLGLTVELDPTLPHSILGDGLRIRQVVTNLVDNAIKFTSNGGVRIQVNPASSTPPMVRIRVIDTGIGMDAATLQRLFQAFEQADRSTTRRFGGTGLGLALSRQLALLMGGDLLATSEPGHGSCFDLLLPAVPADHVPATTAVAPASATATDATATSGLHVLVVEDGKDNQRLVQAILRRMGCSMTLAEDGKAGVETWQLAPDDFDCILMDLQMPVMDGLQATMLLRQLGCRLPIYALTANAMPEDREACRQAGCDGFLTKPIVRKDLQAALAAARRSKQGMVAQNAPSV